MKMKTRTKSKLLIALIVVSLIATYVAAGADNDLVMAISATISLGSLYMLNRLGSAMDKERKEVDR